MPRTETMPANRAMKITKHLLCFWAVVILFTGRAPATVRYVDLNSPAPASPYTSWATAATNIQDAVDAAVAGDTVLVTNGVYATGGRMWADSGTNRVTLTNAVTLQSVNGPAVTLIVGNKVAGTGLTLTNATRCVAMGLNAVLSGFTLTNGQAGWGNSANGGGVSQVQSISAAGTVTNCVLIDNLSTNGAGGGAYRVNLINCLITGNHAKSGGGAGSCALFNCTVVSNTAPFGGGVAGGSCNNCTIVGNAAVTGGGVYNTPSMNNCVIYYNSAGNHSGSKFAYCCTTPTFNGDFTSFTNAPLFVNLAASDFHLQTNSPCINAGNNTNVTNTTDLDGNPRIAGGTVDIGAYEFPSPASVLSYAWAQQNGLPTDGSADYLDADGDGLNNWQEWKAGTVPTNAVSVLQMSSATNGVSGMGVTWQSVSGVTYYLQRSTNLPVFSSLQSNLVGQAGSTSYTDATATNGGPYFYRVGVQ